MHLPLVAVHWIVLVSRIFDPSLRFLIPDVATHTCWVSFVLTFAYVIWHTLNRTVFCSPSAARALFLSPLTPPSPRYRIPDMSCLSPCFSSTVVVYSIRLEPSFMSLPAHRVTCGSHFLTSYSASLARREHLRAFYLMIGPYVLAAAFVTWGLPPSAAATGFFPRRLASSLVPRATFYPPTASAAFGPPLPVTSRPLPSPRLSGTISPCFSRCTSALCAFIRALPLPLFRRAPRRSSSSSRISSSFFLFLAAWVGAASPYCLAPRGCPVIAFSSLLTPVCRLRAPWLAATG